MDISPLATLFAILGALLIGAISPGPSFVFVVRTAAAQSRRDGLAAALGMGVGAMAFGALALVGLHTLITSGGWLYTGLKIAGGLYLVYLAWRIWQHAGGTDRRGRGRAPAPTMCRAPSRWRSPPSSATPRSSRSLRGLRCAPARQPAALAGPRPAAAHLRAGDRVVPLVALAFSSARPRAVYLRAKTWIDRAAGAVIGALGLRLIWEAR